MKFRKDSNEQSCAQPVSHGALTGLFACMRTKGHPGSCIAAACAAAIADGVCHACRLPRGTGHRDDCYASPPVPTLPQPNR